MSPMREDEDRALPTAEMAQRVRLAVKSRR
jgi:hypothetical protein